MSNHLLPLSIFALAAAIAWHGMPRAEADEPSRVTTAVCATVTVPRQEEWMTRQLRSGRSHFIGLGNTRFCAW